jgi:hypothetical protein
LRAAGGSCKCLFSSRGDDFGLALGLGPADPEPPPAVRRATPRGGEGCCGWAGAAKVSGGMAPPGPLVDRAGCTAAVRGVEVVDEVPFNDCVLRSMGECRFRSEGWLPGLDAAAPAPAAAAANAALLTEPCASGATAGLMPSRGV